MLIVLLAVYYIRLTTATFVSCNSGMPLLFGMFVIFLHGLARVFLHRINVLLCIAYIVPVCLDLFRSEGVIVSPKFSAEPLVMIHTALSLLLPSSPFQCPLPSFCFSN